MTIAFCTQNALKSRQEDAARYLLIRAKLAALCPECMRVVTGLSITQTGDSRGSCISAASTIAPVAIQTPGHRRVTFPRIPTGFHQRARPKLSPYARE